jgi:hypothetical protein
MPGRATKVTITERQQQVLRTMTRASTSTQALAQRAGMIEIWFSILVRRVLKRGNFPSVSDLPEKILAFIDYFNRTMAKPFKWTYTGRPLNV